MKNKVLLFIVVLFTNTIFSQEVNLEKINYKKIEKEVIDKESELYYPKLVEKFNKGDTTMTLKEKRHLYYGFITQKEYSAYNSSVFNDSLRSVLNNKMLFVDDYKRIIKYSDLILKSFPFDISVMSYKLFAYNNLENEKEYFKTLAKANIIIDAILSTGNGINKKSPIYVIKVSNEYDILGVLGYQFGGSQSLIGNCDYLELAENENNIEGLYFDISASLDSLKNMFKK